MDSWFLKSSCCDKSCAMQQFQLSKGQTGEHLAFRCLTLKPHSSRTSFRPFASPDAVIIFWGWPQSAAVGFDKGITVSCCFRCFPPFDLFISQARRASGVSDPWADDWSKKNRSWQLGCTSLAISRAVVSCARSCVVSHHGSSFNLGKIIFHAS